MTEQQTRPAIPPHVYALNAHIRAAQARLDELNRLLESQPSASLARAVEAQERKLDAWLAKHPDYR